ncbi:DUF3040 domain-containing protein [Glaciibacter psychrotolerans]|uniref:Putative membrane protein n=1 Tax=Glaciibacter psychrotolerans TaxID=670054 RepID=A0A7Z0ED33_9MICO|nr:DUF3040 domain-containing protein [Leifsonia psychrotolerans]NYJ18809.1 putative membrane protein [Leifsonia psychrotolerans]
MPLSEQEQRLLEEMERSLYHNDADFVATVGATRLRPNYRSIALGVLLVVAGIALLITGVALHLLWLGIIGFVVMFAGVLLAISPGRSASHFSAADAAAASGARSTQSRGADQGFMDKMNDRWDRRQDGHV